MSVYDGFRFGFGFVSGGALSLAILVAAFFAGLFLSCVIVDSWYGRQK